MEVRPNHAPCFWWQRLLDSVHVLRWVGVITFMSTCIPMHCYATDVTLQMFLLALAHVFDVFSLTSLVAQVPEWTFNQFALRFLRWPVGMLIYVSNLDTHRKFQDVKTWHVQDPTHANSLAPRSTHFPLGCCLDVGRALTMLGTTLKFQSDVHIGYQQNCASRWYQNWRSTKGNWLVRRKCALRRRVRSTIWMVRWNRNWARTWRSCTCITPMVLHARCIWWSSKIL